MSRSATLSPDQQSLKAAFKALAKAFGGQVAVEAETGIRQQEISDFGLPNVARFAPIDLIDHLAEMAAEFGDVSRAVTDAVCPHGPDGEEVNPNEARLALDALADLDRVSAQLRLKLTDKLKGETA